MTTGSGAGGRRGARRRRDWRSGGRGLGLRLGRAPVDGLDPRLFEHGRGRVHELLYHGVDRALRGDHGVHVALGHHGDVVDGERVDRVGERDEQGAVVVECDRDRAVALCCGLADQPRDVHVHLELAQVDVVEAVELGGGAGELILVEDAGLEQNLGDGLADDASLLDRPVGGLLIHEAELDDDVVEEARGAFRPGRRGDAAARGPDVFEDGVHQTPGCGAPAAGRGPWRSSQRPRSWRAPPWRSRTA